MPGNKAAARGCGCLFFWVDWIEAFILRFINDVGRTPKRGDDDE